jgi:steroid delta-isomerase-like uncharacterized protein
MQLTGKELAMSRSDLERLDDLGIAAWDRHDSEAFTSLFADEFVWLDDTTPEPMRSKEAARQYTEAWFTAFPDMRVRETQRLIDGDCIATELEFTGTNTGPVRMAGQEIPPTGKSVTGRGSYFARTEGGKIKEFHSHPDAAGLMMQLGLMPA